LNPIRLAAVVAAAGASVCVHAQGSVTVFGLVDTATVYSDTGTARIKSLDSGVVLGSRVGFRGEEDLGDGAKALFMLEMGLNNDTGALAQGGLGFGRQSYVGLSSPSYGRLTLGRHYSVLHTELATYTMGGLIWGNALNYFRDGSVLRLDNSIRYETPVFAGLSARLLVAAGEGSATGKVVNPSFDYKLGRWQIGGSSMYRVKTATNTERYTVLGTSYDFQWLKAALAYYRQRDELAAATSLARDACEVSAVVPFGVSAVWLSYGRDSGKARPQTDGAAISARYDYNLSKRTRLYVGYTVIQNDAKSNFTVNTASNAGPIVVAGNDVKQAVLGISHAF